ncbi:phosphoribosylglycinamide formyltransferase [Arcanobacterium hippocoleae]
MAGKAKVAVLISGGGTNLQAIIDGIASGKLTHTVIDLVVSNRAGAFGIERAKSAGIETAVLAGAEYRGNKPVFEAELLRLLREHEIELVVLAGFMAILSADFIQRCPCRIVNIHPSLIPAFSGEGFYGLRVHQAAIAAGVKISGATVHLVNEVCDGGQILAQETVPVLETDTPEVLQERILHEVEHVIFPRTIEQLCAEIVNQRQRTAAAH